MAPKGLGIHCAWWRPRGKLLRGIDVFQNGCGSKRCQDGKIWQVETWTKTCVTLLFNFEHHPNGLDHRKVTLPVCCGLQGTRAISKLVGIRLVVHCGSLWCPFGLLEFQVGSPAPYSHPICKQGLFQTLASLRFDVIKASLSNPFSNFLSEVERPFAGFVFLLVRLSVRPEPDTLCAAHHP